MSDLTELRQKIDAIDTELLRLLNERATVAKEIGVIKNKSSLPIYSPDREMKLLRSLVERSKGPLGTEAIHAIYREIMSASIALEKDVAIACLGPSGSPSHQSSLRKFGSSVRYTLLPSIAVVFEEVSSNRADCGVVPMEDPEHGFLGATLDELAETELSICTEMDSEFAEGPRHIVIGRQSNAPSGHDQTLVLLRLANKPGALVSALEPFRENQINLTHFASRTSRDGKSETLFFVQADGHKNDLEGSDLFQSLSQNCRAVKILGSYPIPQK